MKPRERIATARIPGGTEELQLWRHDSDYTLRLGRIEVMSTRVHGSEEQLAELALAARKAPAANVLIGGLGMGFTLARVLALVGPAARVEVAELVPEVIAWNRELVGDCAGHPLRDARVVVHEGDVAERIATAGRVFDVILLDVDNGPEGLVRGANVGLYDRRGLARAAKALRPGGVFALWSSAPDPHFARRLRDAGFRVTQHDVRARGHKGPRRTIWTGCV